MANAQELAAKAANCRRFAQEMDGLTMRRLLEFAGQYEAEPRLQLAYPATPQPNPCEAAAANRQ
jgi:hypothetical protein